MAAAPHLCLLDELCFAARRKFSTSMMSMSTGLPAYLRSIAHLPTGSVPQDSSKV